MGITGNEKAGKQVAYQDLTADIPTPRDDLKNKIKLQCDNFF